MTVGSIRVRFDLARKSVIRIAVAYGGQVAGGLSLLIVERRIIDATGQKQNALVIGGLRNDVDLISAFPAKAGRTKAMTRRAGIFELTFKQHVPGLASQRGENLALCKGRVRRIFGSKFARDETGPAC
jgi:hypothetical protein